MKRFVTRWAAAVALPALVLSCRQAPREDAAEAEAGDRDVRKAVAASEAEDRSAQRERPGSPEAAPPARPAPPPGDPPAADVRMARTPPAIDGVLDDACWRASSLVRADYPDGSPGVLGENRMHVRYAWDEQYLYVGYETFDRNLVAKGSGGVEGPEGNRREGASIHDPNEKIDVAEFFVTFDDPVFFWELHHNALNQWNDVWCVVPPGDWAFAKSSLLTYGIHLGVRACLEDDGEHRWAAAVVMKPKADGGPSTVNDPRDEDTGYTGEIRLPWKALGAPAARAKEVEAGGKKSTRWEMAGTTLRIFAMVQNYDLPVRYHHSSPTREGGWAHKCFADWPAYRLIEE